MDLYTYICISIILLEDDEGWNTAEITTKPNFLRHVIWTLHPYYMIYHQSTWRNLIDTLLNDKGWKALPTPINRRTRVAIPNKQSSNQLKTGIQVSSEVIVHKHFCVNSISFRGTMLDTMWQKAIKKSRRPRNHLGFYNIYISHELTLERDSSIEVKKRVL